jgi:hypothetical protein
MIIGTIYSRIGVAWLIILGTRFDDWIYWTSLLQLQSIITAHNQSWPPRPLFILLLVPRLLVKVKVKVTLRLTVCQSVSPGVEPHLGIMTRYLLLFDGYGLVLVGRPLWRENESVFCICCWPSPAQYFSGPSPLGLATIFYYLRFETSLFIASYDS